MTASLAEPRNDLVVQMARRLLFRYAPPDSRTGALPQCALAWGKEVLSVVAGGEVLAEVRCSLRLCPLHRRHWNTPLHHRQSPHGSWLI